MEPEQHYNFHCDIFIHILFATMRENERSDTAIKTQYKTPKI